MVGTYWCVAGLLLFVFADWDFVGLGCLGLFILVSVSVFLSFLFYRFWFEFMICVVWGSLWLVLWVLCSVGGLR